MKWIFSFVASRSPIKDFALIDSDYLEFSKGFTVLSGETGAGKSILIGALSFLLGGKADIQQIRAGKKEASVSGTFLLTTRVNLEFPVTILIIRDLMTPGSV